VEQLKIPRKITVDEFREAVRRRLRKPDLSHLPLEDSQLLVAGFFGFDNWEDLLRGYPSP
jgi:hypothetical protein